MTVLDRYGNQKAQQMNMSSFEPYCFYGPAHAFGFAFAFQPL